jgi:hypothetical protein
MQLCSMCARCCSTWDLTPTYSTRRTAGCIAHRILPLARDLFSAVVFRDGIWWRLQRLQVARTVLVTIHRDALSSAVLRNMSAEPM